MDNIGNILIVIGGLTMAYGLVKLWSILKQL